LAAARAEFEALRGKPEGNEAGSDGRPKRAIARQKMTRLQNELAAATDPAASGTGVAFGVRDSQTVGDTEIRVRGEAEQLGPIVPRGLLSVVRLADRPTIGATHSGRLELARWLTDPANPLASRVIVNRLWHHLFGRGIVGSVDNFGIHGDTPSHPELLDYLAGRFVGEGWSIKKLVRHIALSHAYRLSSDALPAIMAVDPDNRLLWRHQPRRLDAEELRDAALAAAGTLDGSPGEASPVNELKMIELRNNGPEARRLADLAYASRRRSVYLPLLRGLTPRPLEVFDFAEQGMVTGDRDTTTVATQALYLLNDPFVRRQSLALAERLLARAELDDAERVNAVYRRALGRPATAPEVERALRYVGDYAAAVEQVDASVAAARSTSAPSQPMASNSKPKKKPPKNPDEADQTDDPVAEELIAPSTPTAAAWASFCQALFGSAEFRYLK
jgi:hypothetical protein